MNRLDVEHDEVYSPASHVQGPFLVLLRQHPLHGVRLINGLCNHAMAAWRRILGEEHRTPLPTQIIFPWGTCEFWGHGRELRWFRGMGPGPDAVLSALMALEVWMEEQASHRDLSELFQQVLADNSCIGAVGACVSIALAHPAKALAAALPLVTCRALWDWDIQRCVEEQHRTNQIGNWLLERHLLEPVRERNLLPHRARSLPFLVPWYLFSEDASLRKAFSDAWQAPHEPPFEFEEARRDPDEAALRLQRLGYQDAVVEPSNWRVETAPDGPRFHFTSPTETSNAEALSEGTQFLRDLGMVALAEKSLDAGALQPGITIEEAFQRALQLDHPGLFYTYSASPELQNRRRTLVAAVAALVARFAEPSSEDMLAWCQDVLLRAAATWEGDAAPYRNSSLIYHPVPFASAGLAALLARGINPIETRVTLLCLVAHPVLAIVEATLKSIWRLWEREPLLGWQALVLAIRLSVPPLRLRSAGLGGRSDARESAWVARCVKHTLKELHRGKLGMLPYVPWKTTPGGAWLRNLGRMVLTLLGRRGQVLHAGNGSSDVFTWDLAGLALNHLPIEQVMSSPVMRRSLVALCENLIDWLIARGTGPDGRTDSTVVFSWGAELLEFCARLSRQLPYPETKRIVLERIRATSASLGLQLTGLFMGSLLEYRIESKAPSPDVNATWSDLCSWVLNHPSVEESVRSRYLNDEISRCVDLVLFIELGRCRLEPGWSGLLDIRPFVEEWVRRLGGQPELYLRLLVLLETVNGAWLPEPGFEWIERILVASKDDPEFWSEPHAHRTAKLLHRAWLLHRELIERQPESRARLVRLTDLLVSKGANLAATLQRELVVRASAGSPDRT